MVNFDWIRQPNGYLKIFNLLLSTICLGLFLNGLGVLFMTESEAKMLTCIVPVTSVVLVVFILIYTVDCNFGNIAITETVFNVAYGILNIVVAGIVIDSSHEKYINDYRKDERIAFEVMMILLGLVMLVDAFVAFRTRSHSHVQYST